MKNGKKWKIMTFIVATNVVASQPPELGPLERRTLVPIIKNQSAVGRKGSLHKVIILEFSQKVWTPTPP